LFFILLCLLPSNSCVCLRLHGLLGTSEIPLVLSHCLRHHCSEVVITCFNTSLKHKGEESFMPKWNRTRFSVHEVEVLSEWYTENAYPDNTDISSMAVILNKSNRCVKVWFQNKRQRSRRRITCCVAMEPLPNACFQEALHLSHLTVHLVPSNELSFP
jgi:hypothetical protein